MTAPPIRPALAGYGRQCIGEDDIAAVVSALRSEFLTQGPRVVAFEAALAQACGARHAVAVANGTAALHLACLALELPPGAVGITSALTFAASANGLELAGGRADFADVREDTVCVDAQTLADAAARHPTGRVRVLLPVHYAGRSCPMPEIATLARGLGAAVIEDACHALGATYTDGAGRSQKVGACAHSDMAVLSFHPVKHVTTGEGGAILTNDDTLARRMRVLRTHGIESAPDRMQVDSEAFDPATGEKNAWYHEMQVLGLNYRLTDLQAALGTSQLAKLDRFVAARRSLARAYDRELAPLGFVRTPGLAGQEGHAWHLYPVRIDFGALGQTRHQVMATLRSAGIGTQVHYIPVPFHPYYRRRYDGPAWPAAEAFYRQCLSLPMHPGMDEEDVAAVASALARLVPRR